MLTERRPVLEARLRPTPFLGQRVFLEVEAQAGELRARIGSPIVVGFGIDSGEKARAAATHADGVVCGTAIVRAIEDGKTPEARKRAVTELVRALRVGIDAPLS